MNDLRSRNNDVHIKNIYKLLLINLILSILLLVLLTGFATYRTITMNGYNSRVVALELQSQSQNSILSIGVKNSAENRKILEKIQSYILKEHPEDEKK